MRLALTSHIQSRSVGVIRSSRLYLQPSFEFRLRTISPAALLLYSICKKRIQHTISAVRQHFCFVSRRSNLSSSAAVNWHEWTNNRFISINLKRHQINIWNHSFNRAQRISIMCELWVVNYGGHNKSISSGSLISGRMGTGIIYLKCAPHYPLSTRPSSRV